MLIDHLNDKICFIQISRLLDRTVHSKKRLEEKLRKNEIEQEMITLQEMGARHRQFDRIDIDGA